MADLLAFSVYDNTAPKYAVGTMQNIYNILKPILFDTTSNAMIKHWYIGNHDSNHLTYTNIWLRIEQQSSSFIVGFQIFVNT